MTEPLPVLRLVPIDDCVLHESIDPQRVERLMAALDADGRLRNPAVAARAAQRDKLMILDGATRTTALRQLGLGSLPVQIVNYADHRIELHTWAHLLHNVNAHSLLRVLRAIDGLHIRQIDAREVDPASAPGEICELLSADGDAWVLEGGADIHAQARLLDQVFHTYVRRAAVQRLPHDDRLTAASLPAGTIAVIFPRYTKLDLLALSHAGDLLPGGITRHVIPGRVLRLNVPLEPLRSGSVAAQQSWFDAWVSERIAAGRARLYNEPTWLFDE